MGINIIIVLNIIFMVGGGDKQRIEINHLYTQVLEIIHFIQHSLQIPAVEFPYIHLGRISVPVLHTVHMLPDIGIFVGEHVVGGIPIAETVHIDLVHDGALGPVRRLKAGQDHEIIVFIHIPGQPSHIIDAGNLARLHLEMIHDFLILQLEFIGVIVKQSIRLCPAHQMAPASAHDKHPVHIVPCGPEANSHPVVRGRL